MTEHKQEFPCIYLGADHRGYAMKNELVRYLQEKYTHVFDMGPNTLVSDDDYVDFARAVTSEVIKSPNYYGILLCGSGVGMDIAANKVKGVRCSLVVDEERAAQSRSHEDANILSLPSDILTLEKAKTIVDTFLATPFSGEVRHIRRLKKLADLEKGQRSS